MPAAALGLASIFAHLLEHWKDIRVYRLLAELEGSPETYVWSWDRSQFEVDDWVLEDLDENVAIWGDLKTVDTGLRLDLYIEDDTATGSSGEEDAFVKSLSATDLASLIAELPSLARQVVELLGATREDKLDPVYGPADADDGQMLPGLLENMAHWDIRLLLNLWGQEWSDDDILASFRELVQSARLVGGRFGAWCIARAAAYAMRPGLSVVGELLVPEIDELVDSFGATTWIPIVISQAIYRLGYVEDAFQMLEDVTQDHPNEVLAWLKLADLYAQGGRLIDAIQAIQTAIENDIADHRVYRFYGNLLSAANQYEVPVQHFFFVERTGTPDHITQEAIESYDKAIEISPEDVVSLHQQLLLLAAAMDNQRFWPGFEKLIGLDETGEWVRDVIDAMYDLEDIEPAFALLQKAVKATPDRVDLYVNLAAAYLIEEKVDEALHYLQQAEERTDNEDVLAEIEQLKLMAEIPDFEQRFGEIAAIIDAANSPSTGDVDFLEEVVEMAPSFIPAYLILARAYILWEDQEAALEVLLDAQQRDENNADVLEVLAGVLWDTGEHKLAFEYLNKGIMANPNHVPLLVRTGRLLFDTGQLAEARAYLARAEMLAPRSAALAQVRRYIASKMSDAGDAADDK